MKGSLGLGYLSSTYFSTKKSLILPDVSIFSRPICMIVGKCQKVFVICWASCLVWLRQTVGLDGVCVGVRISCRRLVGETRFLLLVALFLSCVVSRIAGGDGQIDECCSSFAAESL